MKYHKMSKMEAGLTRGWMRGPRANELPCYTREQLDNAASEKEFRRMVHRIADQYRRFRYVRGGTDIVFENLKPIHPDAWKIYRQKRKEMQEKTTSSDDNNDSMCRDVESLHSPVDVLTIGLNAASLDDKAGFEGPSSNLPVVGTERNATVVGSLVDPVKIGAEQTLEVDEAVKIGAERTLEVDEGLLSAPLDVSSDGPKGNSMVHPDLTFDPLNDENASREKAEETMANKKISTSMKRYHAGFPLKIVKVVKLL